MFSNQEYVCTLSQRYLEITRNELEETESKRTQCIEQLKEWFQKHSNVHSFTIRKDVCEVRITRIIKI